MGLFFDILISLAAGVYSGLIASKYIRYVHIKTQAVQLVQRVEHVHDHDEPRTALLRRRDLDHLGDLAHELDYLDYRATAGLLRDLERTLRDATSGPRTGPDDTEALYRRLDSELQTLRRQRPATLPTLKAWLI